MGWLRYSTGNSTGKALREENKSFNSIIIAAKALNRGDMARMDRIPSVFAGTHWD